MHTIETKGLRTVGDAPGRVNLLGEHTDYSGGFVLPTAIPQTSRVELTPGTTDGFRVYSEALGQTTLFKRSGKAPPGFARYIFGCIEVLCRRGVVVPDLDVHIASTVPIGVGLSSSAALEVSMLRALRNMLDLDFNDVQLALLAQQAEIEYAGVHCGVMDQMASSLCNIDSMLFLDTRSLAYRLLPLPEAACVIAIDSNTPRSLAATAYNQRREECELAARLLGVPALRDVADPGRAARLPHPLNRRARHVITENHRVEQAIGATAKQFGALMNASHASLRDDHDVSLRALDCLAQCLRDQPGVYGARLTGAGFGGACVALVARDAADGARDGALNDFGSAGFSGRALL